MCKVGAYPTNFVNSSSMMAVTRSVSVIIYRVMTESWIVMIAASGHSRPIRFDMQSKTTCDSMVCSHMANRVDDLKLSADRDVIFPLMTCNRSNTDGNMHSKITDSGMYL